MKADAALTLIVIAAAALAASLAVPPRTVMPTQYDPVDSVLARNIGSWVVDEQPVTLDQAISRFSKSTGVRIELDWPELERAGISRIRREVPSGRDDLRGALYELLRQFWASPPQPSDPPPPRFSMTDNGSLLISIEDDLDTTLRIYDVHDLLSDSYWGGRVGPSTKDSVKPRIDRIVEFIKTRSGIDYDDVHAGSESQRWIPENQTGALGGKLFITTTRTRHRQIERVFASLRYQAYMSQYH